MTGENESWDPVTQQTYTELFYYYKSSGYYNEVGYVSEEYQSTYYDGYGLNHYYGNYGYYEYSRAPSPPSSLVWDAGRFAKTLIIMIVILVTLVFMYVKCHNSNEKSKKKEALLRQKTSNLQD
jgi:hypothetical protein